MAGKYEEEKQSRNIRRFELVSNSSNYSSIEKNVIDISDITTLREKGEVIVFLENRYYRARKQGYYQIPELVEYSDRIKEINETESLFIL